MLWPAVPFQAEGQHFDSGRVLDVIELEFVREPSPTSDCFTRSFVGAHPLDLIDFFCVAMKGSGGGWKPCLPDLLHVPKDVLHIGSDVREVTVVARYALCQSCDQSFMSPRTSMLHYSSALIQDSPLQWPRQIRVVKYMLMHLI